MFQRIELTFEVDYQALRRLLGDFIYEVDVEAGLHSGPNLNSVEDIGHVLH